MPCRPAVHLTPVLRYSQPPGPAHPLWRYFRALLLPYGSVRMGGCCQSQGGSPCLSKRVKSSGRAGSRQCVNPTVNRIGNAGAM